MSAARAASSRRKVWLHAGALVLGALLALLTAPRAPAAEPSPATEAELDEETATVVGPVTAVTAAANPNTVDPDTSVDVLGRAYGDGLVITGATPHRLILFSFDDGPDVRTTQLLLDRLAEADVHALFFLVASRLTEATPRERQQSAIAREIAARGHLIGGHTVNHVQLPLLDDEEVKAELDQQDAALRRLFGAPPALFRPPYGARSERIDQLLAARGYTTVLWNLGSGDFQVRSADEVFELWKRVLEHREQDLGERGGIVLLHDTYAWSVDAFERIHGYLMARNCELLARDEELYDIVDDLRFFYTPRAGQPASTEAPAAQLDPAELAQRQAVLRARTEVRCQSLANSF